MSHPGVGMDSWNDLKKADKYIVGDEAYTELLPMDGDRFGFDGSKRAPYTFNPAPFIADRYPCSRAT